MKLERFGVPCAVCGAMSFVTKTYLDQGRGKFCSHACSAKFHKPSKRGRNVAESEGPKARSHLREYNSWSAMRHRCTNPKHHKFSAYGAAGVTICDSWNSFQNFLRDMGPRPDGTTLDRIDGKKGYSKENCRWATAEQQNRNVRTNVRVKYKGKEYLAVDLATELGISQALLRYRIRAGWAECDISKPPRHKN